mgnify:CR=1 FL=1
MLDAPFPLRERVSLAADDRFTAAYPAHFGATVTARIGGEVVSATVADAWGDSENPMAPAAIRAKFAALADHAGVPPATAEALADAALALAGTGQVSSLLALLRSCPLKGPA